MVTRPLLVLVLCSGCTLGGAANSSSSGNNVSIQRYNPPGPERFDACHFIGKVRFTAGTVCPGTDDCSPERVDTCRCPLGGAMLSVAVLESIVGEGPFVQVIYPGGTQIQRYLDQWGNGRAAEGYVCAKREAPGGTNMVCGLSPTETIPYLDFVHLVFDEGDEIAAELSAWDAIPGFDSDGRNSEGLTLQQWVQKNRMNTMDHDAFRALQDQSRDRAPFRPFSDHSASDPINRVTDVRVYQNDRLMNWCAWTD